MKPHPRNRLGTQDNPAAKTEASLHDLMMHPACQGKDLSGRRRLFSDACTNAVHESYVTDGPLCSDAMSLMQCTDVCQNHRSAGSSGRRAVVVVVLADVGRLSASVEAKHGEPTLHYASQVYL